MNRPLAPLGASPRPEPLPAGRLDTKLCWMEKTVEQWAQAYQNEQYPEPHVWEPYVTYLVDTYMENAWESLLPWPEAVAQRWSLGLVAWGLLMSAYALGTPPRRSPEGHTNARTTADTWALVGVRAGWEPCAEARAEGVKGITRDLAHSILGGGLSQSHPDHYYTHSQGLTATWWGEIASHWTGLVWGTWVLSLYPIYTLGTEPSSDVGGRAPLPQHWTERLMTFVHERFHTSWKTEALWMLTKPQERWLFHWRTSEKVIKDPYTLLTTFREGPQMNSLDERLQRPPTHWKRVLQDARYGTPTSPLRPGDPVNDAFVLSLLNHLMRVETHLADWKSTWVRLHHELETQSITRWEKTPYPLVLQLQGHWFLWYSFKFIHTASLWEAWALWVVTIERRHLPSHLLLEQTSIWDLATFILSTSSITRLPYCVSIL